MADLTLTLGNLLTAEERLDLIGRTAGQVLLRHKDDVETVRLMHELISDLGWVRNRIRFTRRQLEP